MALQLSPQEVRYSGGYQRGGLDLTLVERVAGQLEAPEHTYGIVSVILGRDFSNVAVPSPPFHPVGHIIRVSCLPHAGQPIFSMPASHYAEPAVLALWPRLLLLVALLVSVPERYVRLWLKPPLTTVQGPSMNMLKS